jgi:hypothetical protein
MAFRTGSGADVRTFSEEAAAASAPADYTNFCRSGRVIFTYDEALRSISRLSARVHEQCEQQDERQRNASQPKQSIF